MMRGVDSFIAKETTILNNLDSYTRFDSERDALIQVMRKRGMNNMNKKRTIGGAGKFLVLGLVIIGLFLAKSEFFDGTQAEVIDEGMLQGSTVQTVASSGTNHNFVKDAAENIVSKLKAITVKSTPKKTTPAQSTITHASGGGSSSASATADTTPVTVPITNSDTIAAPVTAAPITNPTLPITTPSDPVEPEPTLPEAPVDVSDLTEEEFEQIIEVPNLNFVAGILTKEGLDKLEGSFLVKEDVKQLIEDDGELRVIIDYKNRFIERDRQLYMATAESFPLIKADVVRNSVVNNIGINGTGQTVCVIDSGVYYNHSELGNCTTAEFLAGNCTKVIGGWDFFNNDSDPIDDANHGTGIAGIIAADGPTYKGIAPGAKIVALKISNNVGAGWTSIAAAAVNWCVNNASTYNITTISFAFSDNTQNNSHSACDNFTLTNAMANAVANNISVYAAAGHSAYINGISYPACGSAPVSVSATDDGTLGSQFLDTVWPSSNRGSILDLWAPGRLITFLRIPSGTGAGSGTSLAMAHAVGSDILIRQYNQARYNVNPDPTYIKNALTLTGFNITDNSTGGSNLTFPRIDLVRAVNYETLAPAITLISPANYTKVIPPGNVNFTYNVTDHHEILNCDLYVNNIFNQTNTNVQRGTTYQFGLTNLGPGVYNWEIRCRDNSTIPNTGISGRIYRVNSPPTISSIPTQAIAEDSGTNNADLTSYMNDNDADSLTMTILAENTAQVDCGTSGLTLTMTPASDYFGVATCLIKVDDGQQDSNNMTVTINVTSVNDAPVITSTAVTSASVGTQYTYTVIATDVENDPLTFSLTTSPAGMTINSTTGVITWTPVSGQQGNNAVTVQVSDGNGGTPTQSFTINVANAQPAITTTAVTSASVGTQYSYDVNATDADLDTLTYSLTTFPAGMNINSATGLITWTPVSGQQGNNNVVVQVTDGFGGSTTQSFTINVANAQPVITTTAITSGNVAVLYSYDVNATDADLDTLTYALTANPSGMNIDSNTGLIQWTPGMSQRGPNLVTVQVTDGFGGSATQSFNITVPNIAPVLNFISDINVNEGQLVTITPSGSDAENDTLTYSFTSPLDASGQWQTTYTDAGNYSVTVAANDGYGGSDSQVVTITVTNIPVADVEVQYFVKQAPASPTAGNDIVFGFLIRNIGEVIANNINWLLDSGTSDANATGTLTSLNTNAGQLVMGRLNYALPGSYNPRIVLDYNYNIAELNETNNIKTVNVVVS